MTDDEAFASPRSRLVALLLGSILGVFGAHRFYVGKVGSGVAQAITLGGLGLWWIYDVILISAGSFRDAEGRLVVSWEPEGDHLLSSNAVGDILDELDGLRSEVGELRERLEFTERLLAQPRGDNNHSPTGRGDSA